MDLDRIQQALEELVHLKGKGVSRELIDQLVYRVTPVSETHFEWYLHLDPEPMPRWAFWWRAKRETVCLR